MPIDTSILTNQSYNPLEAYARISQIKGMQQEQQLQALQLKQQQQDFADQQTARQVIASHQGNLDSALPELAGKVSPKAFLGLQNAVLESQTKRAGLAKTQGESAKAESEFFGNLANGVAKGGYDPNALSAALDTVTKAYPNYAQHAQQIAQAAQQNPQAIKGIIDSVITSSGVGMEERKTAAQEATAQAHQRQAGVQEQELPGKLKAQDLAAQESQQKIAGTVPQTIQQQAELRFQQQKAAQEDKRRGQELGIQGARLGVEKERLGFDTNGGVTPTAQAIFEGRIDPQTTRAMLRRSPGLLNQVQTAAQAAGTKFDEGDIDSRFNTLKEFNNTSASKAGGQVVALNTLIHHADLYQQTAEALKNGTFKPGNAVYNAVASAFGKAPPTNAALVARFFAGETGKVATGGVPAEGEINGILKNLSTSGSPEAMKGAGDTLLQLAAGRMVPLRELAEKNKLGNQVQIVGPDAKAILQRNGYDPNTLAKAPTSTGGKVDPKLDSLRKKYNY